MKLLLSNGASATVGNEEGWTPLHDAARTGSLAVCELLCEAGALVDAKTKGGQTPFHLAAKGGHMKVHCVFDPKVLELIMAKILNLRC